MNSRKSRTKYNYDTLIQYRDENNIELTKDYREESMKRETRIEALCTNPECGGIVNRSFKDILDKGCFCKKCIDEDRKKKYLDSRYGVVPYERSFAFHPKSIQLHPTKNEGIDPKDVFISSKTFLWFLCEICSHPFTSATNDVSNGKWCPYCAKHSGKLCDDNNCNMCFQNSFASVPQSIYISDLVVAPARQISRRSLIEIQFYCYKCHHHFSSTPDKIVGPGAWCPYCANKKVCGKENCIDCFEKSFASCEKSAFWYQSKNGDVKPIQITKSTHKKYFFECSECNHIFPQTPHAINGKHQSFCSYCAIPGKILCEDEECQHCLERSFASHPNHIFWNKTENGNATPRKIFKHTSKKYIFDCIDCKNSFPMIISNITKQNCWCSCTVNKTEAKIKKHLEEEKDTLHIKSIKHHFKPKWTKVHGTYYEYDFYIELTNGVKIIIEVDGRQHYEQVSNWKPPIYNQIRDCIKERLAKKNQINLIRMNQEDIWKDKNNWQQSLHDAITLTLTSNHRIYLLKLNRIKHMKRV